MGREYKLLKPYTYTPPGNETEEHFLLKNVAMVYLKTKMDCRYAAMEVGGLSESDSERLEAWNEFCGSKKRIKEVADAVGVQRIAYASGSKEYSVKCVEAKVSRNDYLSGYCIGGDYNYLITPKGLLDPKEIFPTVGLIEVDFDKLAFNGAYLTGCRLVKRATKPHRPNVDIHRRKQWAEYMILRIADILTIDRVYRGPWVYPGFYCGK